MKKWKYSSKFMDRWSLTLPVVVKLFQMSVPGKLLGLPEDSQGFDEVPTGCVNASPVGKWGFELPILQLKIWVSQEMDGFSLHVNNVAIVVVVVLALDFFWNLWPTTTAHWIIVEFLHFPMWIRERCTFTVDDAEVGICYSSRVVKDANPCKFSDNLGGLPGVQYVDSLMVPGENHARVENGRMLMDYIDWLFWCVGWWDVQLKIIHFIHFGPPTRCSTSSEFGVLICCFPFCDSKLFRFFRYPVFGDTLHQNIFISHTIHVWYIYPTFTINNQPN